MKNKTLKIYKRINSEVESKKSYYLFLTMILVGALFVRAYKTTELMGFYYDQGRDALVIWKFINEGKPFLVGPVTGLQGIFLGPLFYYLITPFYFLSRGAPFLPAVFLAFLTVCGVFMLYYLGWKFDDRKTGLIASFIGGFSYYLMLAGRWLSNPTPIMLTSMLLLWSLWKILKTGKNNYWILVALLVGISLQFESASAIFYIPMVLVFSIWQRNKFPRIKILIMAIFIFSLTLFPQLFFNFRHENILIRSFLHEMIGKESFRLSFWNVVEKRAVYFWTVYSSKILPERPLEVFLVSIPVAYYLIKLIKQAEIKLLIIFIGVPMLGYTLFQGNQGNIYDYYMTGYYLPIILLFSIGLKRLTQTSWGKGIFALYFIFFVYANFLHYKNYFGRSLNDQTYVALGNEIRSVDWIFEDARKEKFNVDVYVPPVIPYSYEYLFLWKGKECGKDMCGYITQNSNILYTLYEVDLNHPQNLEKWLARQEGIGKIIKEAKFGGITVQKRIRL